MVSSLVGGVFFSGVVSGDSIANLWHGEMLESSFTRTSLCNIYRDKVEIFSGRTLR